MSPRPRTREPMEAADETMFRAVVEQCASCIIIQCRERLVYANPAALHCLALPALDGIRGSSLADFFEPDSYATLSTSLCKVTPDDDQLFIGELKLHRRGGGVIDAEVY